MKKRLLTLLLCTSMSVALVACGNTAEPVETEPEEVVEETVEEEPEEVVDEPEEEVEEEPVSLMGFNMIADGDFSEGKEKWSSFTTSGGSGKISYKNKELNVDMLNVGKVEHAVQAYYDGFALETGCVYELQFDASSTVERQIEYRVQINGGDYHAYASEYLTLTPETQHFDFQFTMEEGSDPAPRLCLNMGLIEDQELEAHTLLFDNFELYCIDDGGRIQAEDGPEIPDVLVNQIGYRPNDTKVAVFREDQIDSNFYVIDVKSGNSVLDGPISEAKENRNTMQMEATGDFSALTTPGTYKVVSDKDGESYEFEIKDGIYDEAFDAAVRMLYLQRCGCELTEDLAGDFAHPVCHNEKATVYGTSQKIDVSGGWHDAGDYGRYTVSGVKAVADILLAYEKYPKAFSDQVGIPESGNGVPDILDEAKYELDWLFKMQAQDGGVYHKVTCANFPETVMPQDETEPLLVMPVATPATGDFAAIMAMAYRIYQDVDPAYADKCLAAAKKSADYLESHERASFKNPEDVATGEYPDTADSDERFWAYAELFKSTGDAKYEEAARKADLEKIKYGLGWADVGYYATYAYLTSDYTDKAFANAAKDKMKEGVDLTLLHYNKDSYGSSIFKDYCWGSNMIIADNGMVLDFYSEITGEDYAKEAKAQLDYLLGNNANGYCFLTGFGTLSPTGTHHRPSQFLEKTMPGMLVGGPNANLEDPYAAAVLRDQAAALCYADNSQSFSCNEITVYWNSPLIYLLAECK